MFLRTQREKSFQAALKSAYESSELGESKLIPLIILANQSPNLQNYEDLTTLVIKHPKATEKDVITIFQSLPGNYSHVKNNDPMVNKKQLNDLFVECIKRLMSCGKLKPQKVLSDIKSWKEILPDIQSLLDYISTFPLDETSKAHLYYCYVAGGHYELGLRLFESAGPDTQKIYSAHLRDALVHYTYSGSGCFIGKVFELWQKNLIAECQARSMLANYPDASKKLSTPDDINRLDRTTLADLLLPSLEPDEIKAIAYLKNVLNKYEKEGLVAREPLELLRTCYENGTKVKRQINETQELITKITTIVKNTHELSSGNLWTLLKDYRDTCPGVSDLRDQCNTTGADKPVNACKR